MINFIQYFLNNFVYWLFLVLLLSLMGACNSNKGLREDNGSSYELVKVDSFAVDYLGEIDATAFAGDRTLLVDVERGEFLLVDTTGKILVQKNYPQEGPGSVAWVGGIIKHEDHFYLNTLKGEIVVLNKDLTLDRKIEMPFPTESRDMKSNFPIMGIYQDDLYIHYPGRDGVSPYGEHYFRDNFLLEKVSLLTGNAQPYLNLPDSSEYQSELFHSRSFLSIRIAENKLYLVLDSEPKVHVYDLEKDIWQASLNLHPGKFITIDPQPKPIRYSQTSQLREGKIKAHFPFTGGVMVHYQEGIEQEIFQANELNKRENYYRYPFFQNSILKLYHEENGWSNEILVPKEVQFIIDMVSPDRDFFALRNDEVLGQEADFLTMYRFRLVEK